MSEPTSPLSTPDRQAGVPEPDRQGQPGSWFTRLIRGSASYLRQFLFLCVVSVVLLCLGDRIKAEGMAITRLLARMYAPVVAQQYPTGQRDKIAVVLYDQNFLNTNGLAWPIPYSAHADWLLRMVDVNPRPKAILLDITFGQERDDPSVKELRAALCHIEQDLKIPVFLAALADETGRLKVRTGLESASDKLDSNKQDCFKLVGVKLDQDPVDHIVWNYSLLTYGVEPARPMYRSAALAMAQDAAGLRLDLDPGQENEQLALVWGYLSSQAPGTEPFLQACLPGHKSWQMYIPGLFRQLWEEAPRAPVCPYHDTLSMSQLSSLDSTELDQHIGGRFLIVGAAIPGYNDLFDSPVHGLIPGPYMHAMALDNLLTFGKDYRRSRDWTEELEYPTFKLSVAALAAVAVIFLVHLLGRMASGWFSWQEGEKPFLHALVRAIGWLSRLSVGTVAALLAIPYLQKWFQLGMLPVVDLVTMSLAAEALDYLDKWTSFFERNGDGLKVEFQGYRRKILSFIT